MNYLAHFHLAGDEPTMIAGALLGDFVKGPLRGEFDAALERGVRLHRRIDAFCDSDLTLSESRRQLPGNLQRYSGIIADVVFDYHLSLNWRSYHAAELRSFSNTVYAVITENERTFPPAAQRFGRHLIEHDLLHQYGKWDVVDRVLKSIATRLAHDNPLHRGCEAIDPHRELLQHAFLEFYPRVLSMAQDFRQ